MKYPMKNKKAMILYISNFQHHAKTTVNCIDLHTTAVACKSIVVVQTF